MKAQYLTWEDDVAETLMCTCGGARVQGMTAITVEDVVRIGRIMDKGYTLEEALGQHYGYMTPEYMSGVLADYEEWADMHGVTFTFHELTDDEFYALVRPAHETIRQDLRAADMAEYHAECAAAAHMDDSTYDRSPWEDHDPLRHERMDEAMRAIERMIEDEPIMEQPSQAQIDAMYPREDTREDAWVDACIENVHAAYEAKFGRTLGE